MDENNFSQFVEKRSRKLLILRKQRLSAKRNTVEPEFGRIKIIRTKIRTTKNQPQVKISLKIYFSPEHKIYSMNYELFLEICKLNMKIVFKTLSIVL